MFVYTKLCTYICAIIETQKYIKMETIAKKIKEVKEKPLYVKAAAKFGVSYSYVAKIAVGTRNATRGKGLEVKQWLLQRIANNAEDLKN